METAGPKKRALLSIFVENGWYCGTGLLIASFYFISNFRCCNFLNLLTNLIHFLT